MTRNVGKLDRTLRAIAGLALLVCATVAPVPWTTRLGVFAVMGGYMLFTAVAGTCLGYRLMGRSTCPVNER